MLIQPSRYQPQADERSPKHHPGISSKKSPPMADAHSMMTMGLNIECRLTNNDIGFVG
jgi:hypothetical protein